MAGNAVTFRYSSRTAHTVQFDQGVADHLGGVADFASTSDRLTFATAGVSPYHCGIHPVVQGQVVVQP
jgi:plastocyanin